MKQCPSCGGENPDNAKFCVKCGAPLGPTTYPPRLKLTDHLRYAVDVSSKNLKIFLPYVAFYVGLIALIIVFAVFSIGYLSTNPPESSPEAFFTAFLPFLLVLMAALLCIGVLSTPFLQHVYYSAAVGREVSFRESLRYAVSRFLAFLGADIIGFTLMGVISYLLLSSIPFESLMPSPEPDYTLIYQYSRWLIALVPLFVVFTYVLNIMAWDNVGFLKALRLAYGFILNRFVKLLSLSLILLLAEALLMLAPLGGLVAFVPATIIDIATIDVYIHYQKSREPGITPNPV